MNFLDLAKRTAQECRVNAASLTTVAGQTGEIGRICAWVATAWEDIQRSNPAWRFMRSLATCPTVNGQTSYPASSFTDSKTGQAVTAATFGRWALDYARGDTFRNYVTAAGLATEIPMDPMEYDVWRDTYLIGANRFNFSRPAVLSVAPDDSIVTGPIAAGGYTLLGAYYVKPVTLVADTDVPACPSEFHMAIVYKAMQFYGVSEAAQEILDAGTAWYRTLYTELSQHQAPRFVISGPLC